MAERGVGHLTGKFDDAARAAWLYFVAGKTQDEIAGKMSISRQTAQRLISLAISERLVRVTLEHPIAECMRLADDICARFGLATCDVSPSDAGSAQAGLGAIHSAARMIERWLGSDKPVVMALGTGRSMRAAVDQVAAMDCPAHRLVSLVGNISADGSASYYDVISYLAGRVKAHYYPMPLPVVARSSEERRLLTELATVRSVAALARGADVAFVGIGHVGPNAPLREDGFISAAELDDLIAGGGVGEIVGWVFDRDGKVLAGRTNARVASVHVGDLTGGARIAVATGAKKAAAIRAALAGGLVTGLVTDEATARLILGGGKRGK